MAGLMLRPLRRQPCARPCGSWRSRVPTHRVARRPSGLNRWRPDGRPFRTHQRLVRQRKQLINALRGHLAQFGLVAPKGPASLKVLENALADPASDVPGPVRGDGRDLGRVDKRASSGRRPMIQAHYDPGTEPWSRNSPKSASGKPGAVQCGRPAPVLLAKKPLFPRCPIHIRGDGDVAEWSKAHPC